MPVSGQAPGSSSAKGDQVVPSSSENIIRELPTRLFSRATQTSRLPSGARKTQGSQGERPSISPTFTDSLQVNPPSCETDCHKVNGGRSRSFCPRWITTRDNRHSSILQCLKTPSHKVYSNYGPVPQLFPPSSL